MTDGWRYVLEIRREDTTPVAQVRVALDRDPLRECLRFGALRGGMPPASALAIDCAVEPVWDRDRKEPYLEGLRATSREPGPWGQSVEVGTSCFDGQARAAVAALVTQGTLQTGDRVQTRALAFAAEETNPERVTSRFRTTPSIPDLDIPAGRLDAFTERVAVTLGVPTPGSDVVPVFLPQRTLHEAISATQRAGASETGGLLIGHLRRDTAAGLFLEVTDQLPARHVEASSTKLTFTGDTWTDFRAALDLRQRDEIMLGWWHSHPVHEWCKACPEEKRRNCGLRSDFLSEDDRLLHRTVFPRAYSLALVVNHVGDEAPTFSMFGWSRGVIERREFHVIGATRELVSATQPPVMTTSNA